MRPFRRSATLALALTVATAGCSSHTAGRASSAPTTTQSATLTTATVRAVTITQLNAHLGVGVPPGWAPVDYRNSRVFVPSGWTRLAHGSCIGNPVAAGMVGVGTLPNAPCDPSQYAVAAQAAALIPSSDKPGGRPAFTIHGYDVYDIASPKPGWVFYDVPELAVEIATRGSLGLSILHTLAPSAREIALDPAYETAPTNWRTLTKDGVSLGIPSSWSVLTPDALCGAPVGNSELLLIKPKVLFAPCPFEIPTAADAAHDAVALYLTPHNANAPGATGRSIARLQHTSTTITIYAEPGDPNALDLFVRRTGSNVTHVLTLGLGRDGRIAGGVLASLRATT